MENKRKVTKWLYWFSFAVAIIVIYKTLDNFVQIRDWVKNLIDVLAPFGAGILIAYILYIPCKKIEGLFEKVKKVKLVGKKARTLSIMTTYIIAIILIVILINFIVPPIFQSIIDLTNNFTEYYQIAMEKINELPEDSILKNEVVINLISEIENIDLKQIINMEVITQYAQGAIGIAGKVFDIFVAIVVSVYLLSSRAEILKFIKRLIAVVAKPNTYNKIGRYFKKSNQIFFDFLAGQGLDAIVVGILTSVAMSILGVKYAILLGFMIGLFNLIPYIGAIIAIIIAGIITFFTGGLQQTVIMLIVVTVLQQIDSNIINPKILGNSLQINPILVIFSVTVGGAYFGILGMFLAVPVVTVLKSIIEEFIDSREKYLGEEERVE